MQDWKKQAEHLKFDKSLSYTQISEQLFPNMGKKDGAEKIRNYLRRTARYKQKQKITETGTTSISGNKDGSTTFEGIVALMDGEAITPEIIMRGHNLDADKWDVVTYKTNFWQAQQKGGGTMLLYQSKITVKPKVKDAITFEDIENYFSKKTYENIKLPQSQQYDKSGETLEIDIADLHSGLKAWIEETGTNYDLKIMRDRLLQCFADITQRCKNRTFKQIILANLGDIFHVDNNNQTTTKGTLQQVEGRVEKIIEYTFDTYITIFKMLSKIAPIHFISVKGNHDEIMGYMFAFSLKQRMHGNDNVTFDISANPHKAILIGKSLVGIEHGIENQNIQGDWLVNDYRKLFGQCEYAEVHSGHRHKQSVKEKEVGIVVRGLPAMCNSSAWEHLMGFRAYKAITCYIWHDELLLREMWYSYA